MVFDGNRSALESGTNQRLPASEEPTHSESLKHLPTHFGSTRHSAIPCQKKRKKSDGNGERRGTILNQI
jgi:hypothetical protein